jgi:hypothetical protein
MGPVWQERGRQRRAAVDRYARPFQVGRVGARRVRCRVVGVACFMSPTVPKHGALGHWARSGEFRRIQTDPGRSRQSPHFTLEHARTPDKRGAEERARTAGMVGAEVLGPWSAPASDRGRSGAVLRPGRRAAVTLTSPAHRQSRRETAKAPERAARPGVTTGAAWRDQRRAVAFPLAFSLAFSLALSPGSQQRHTNAPHMEDCPCWESIPTIT